MKDISTLIETFVPLIIMATLIGGVLLGVYISDHYDNIVRWWKK